MAEFKILKTSDRLADEKRLHQKLQWLLDDKPPGHDVLEMVDDLLQVLGMHKGKKTSPIFLNADTRQASIGRKKVYLTLTESRLLACLLKSPGTTLSKATLFECCGMNSFGDTNRTVATHIQRLRGKLGMAAYSIKTVRGVGYRLEK